MQFGVFDHMDRGEQEIGQQYRDRLQLIAAYEGAGFHAYHRAEHHGTPLSVARPETTQWAASQRMNIVTNGPAHAVRAITDQYRLEWENTAHGHTPLPLMGMSRHVVIANTDAAAIAIAEPAYQRWFSSLLYLWRLNNLQIPLNFPEDFRAARALGLCLVGSVATVRETMAREMAESGVNYLLCRIAFGTLPLAQSLQTVAYLRDEILPAWAEVT